MMAERFTLSGTAVPVDPARMLDGLCARFVEHSDVWRSGNTATLANHSGKADLRSEGGQLSIELSCPTAAMLQMVRNFIAEHLFMIAGDEPLELTWADMPKPSALPDFREIRVVSASNVTPHMRRLTVACADVAHFRDGGLHVRLLIPPKGRAPVWPSTRPDGRIDWPKGEDELTVRIYTIRSIDLDRREMDIDFVLHKTCGLPMPGADFAQNARPGDVAGLLGPGGGGVPDASEMILAGDETALPAISRIAAEMPAGSRLVAFVEVETEAEEQPLVSATTLHIRWLHRNGAAAGTTGMLEKAIRSEIERASPDTFVWAGCERSEAKAIRDLLKARGHDRQRSSIGSYWQRPQ